MNRINTKLEDVLDNICHHGCNYVRACIVKLQAHEIFTEVEFINPMDKKIVLQELMSIMEVYDMQTK